MLDKSAWLGVGGSGWCGALSWASSGNFIAIISYRKVFSNGSIVLSIWWTWQNVVSVFITTPR